jgi:hypothetical protein
MSADADEFPDWQSCRPGYLVALSNQAKGARRRRAAVRASVAAVAIFCMVGLSAWGLGRWSQPHESSFGGIACHEVQANLAGYVAGTLPADLAARIEDHLRECHVCRQLLQKMQADQAVAASADRVDVASECPDCPRQIARAAMPTRPSANVEGLATIATTQPLLHVD